MKTQLHIVSSSSATSGGEGLAARRYAESAARAGSDVKLLSRYISGEQGSVSLGEGSFGQWIIPSRNNFLLELFCQYKFIKYFCEKENVSLIHLHGMWSPLLALASLVARKKSLILVISPHGCLEPVALGYKRLKKILALKIYQGPILRMASLFVATAYQEENSIRKLGLKQPIAIIPNGVDVYREVTHVLSNKIRTILFLSRIHPQKGLKDLVEAWAIVRRSGWQIVIAGGDEAGYRSKIEALIRAKGLESDFKFTGFVDGISKQVCFEMADIFILPTYSENFGIAIAEALANELPVITTTGAPWRDLLDHRCGWWVEPGVQGISDALKNAISCDLEELKRMGQRGRQLVLNKYSWEKVGYSASEVSSWLLDSSKPKPVVVREVANDYND